MKEGVTFPIPDSEVYQIVHKAIRKFFHGTPSKEQYDDLVQNSMVRLIDAYKYFDETKGSFSGFVYMQVSWAIWRDNLHYRGKGRQRDFTIYSLDYVIPNGDTTQITIMDTIIDDSQVQQMESELLVEEVLRHFDERDRYLIQQILINGEPVHKIAKKQGTTKNGVYHHLRRIKKKMREVLNESIL